MTLDHLPFVSLSFMFKEGFTLHDQKIMSHLLLLIILFVFSFLPFVHRETADMKDELKTSLIVDMADIENQLSTGGCERIQMGSFVASFHSGIKTIK